MGLQRQINQQRKRDWWMNPSRLRFIACVLCGQAGGQRRTSPLKKMEDPITKDIVYFHARGCPKNRG